MSLFSEEDRTKNYRGYNSNKCLSNEQIKFLNNFQNISGSTASEIWEELKEIIQYPILRINFI